MREEFNLVPLHITVDKRQISFCQNCLLQLLLYAKRYAIVSKEKRKVLEETMRSDKRINPYK